MSKNQNLVDLSIPETELQFQEFSNVGSAAELDIPMSHTMTFNHSPDTPASDNEAQESEALVSEPTTQKNYSFWTLEFYQRYFDVNTDKVLQRILWSMIPKRGQSYLDYHIKPKPDLYGPFWISMTLTFSTAVMGNIANYLQTPANEVYHWRYDFHTVTFAATAIFSYAWIIPLILWAILRWNGDPKIGIIELICIYGYSLAIYVPVSILWVIQMRLLQWILVGAAATLSGSVLLGSTWPVIQGHRKLLVVIGILGLHLLLATGFMLSFFHVPSEIIATTEAIKTISLNHTNAP